MNIGATRSIFDTGEFDRKRTKDHGNDPIRNLRGEASVSVEQIAPEKVLGSTLPSGGNSWEIFPV